MTGETAVDIGRRAGRRARSPALLAAAGFTAGYAAAVLLGRLTRLPGTPLALVWPAAGVSVLWVMWAWGDRRRVAGNLGALAVTTVAMNLFTGTTVVLSLFFAAANLVQALVSVALFDAFGAKTGRLRRPRHLIALFGAGLVGACVSGLIGVTGVALTSGGVGWLTWPGWVLRNGASVFVVASFALRLREPAPATTGGGGNRAETAVFLLLVVVIGGPVAWFSHGLPLAFVLLPFAQWAGLRLTTRFASWFGLVASLVVVLVTLHHRGPFAVGAPAERVLLAQAFLLVFGAVSLVLALYRDERVRMQARDRAAQQAAQEQARLLETIFESISDAVAVVAADGTFLLHNPEAQRLLARDVSEPDKDEWSDYYGLFRLDGTRFPTDELPLSRALAGGSDHAGADLAGLTDVEMVLRNEARPEGLVLSVSARPLPGPPGEHGAVAAFHDVTAMHQAARAVAEARDLLAGVVSAVTEQAVIATDPQGIITLFNPGAERMLGYTADEMIGAGPDVLFDADEIAERSAELGVEPGVRVLAVSARNDQAEVRRWTYRRKDGTRLEVMQAVTAIRGADHALVGFLAVATDITEQRAAEEALTRALSAERAALERLREVDRLKTDFVSTVSHELRTPITSVVGYVDLLREGLAGPVSDEQTELLGVVHRNSQRLLHLVEDLLTLSRMESGAHRLDLHPLDLRGVVEESLAAIAPLHGRRDLTLDRVLPESPVTVAGDASQLERVVMNLLTNAVKFTPDGGRVTLELTVEGAEAVLRVADTGMGIPETEQDRLFTRFFRSSTTRAKAVQGTGLGLSIVASLVGAHDGEVSVRSVPGAGSTFTVRLPLAVHLPSAAHPPRVTPRTPVDDLPRPTVRTESA